MATAWSGTEDTVSADTISADDVTRPPSDGPASPPWRERAVQVPTDPAHLPLVSTAAYVQLDEVGRGGLGRIVRARDTRTGRIVAIKEMRVESPDAAARFVREALVTANLQHPAIVPVYEVGRWPSGQPFYAMKLVTGRPLTQVIAGATELDRRLALVPHLIAVADALAYAHGERVIHRDLKPGNVMVGAHGETVVIDWGLARRLDQGDVDSLPPLAHAAPGDTVIGSILGTPQFMAPEQAHGERVDERADVYAIGAMLYHTLAGCPPYDGLATTAAVIEAVRTRPPEALATLAPGTPRDLLAVVERAMARDVEERYATAAALADDLRRFATGQLVSAHRYSRGERARRFVRRHRGMLAIAAVALVVLGAIGLVSVQRIVREREAARSAERGQRAARAEADAKRADAQFQLATSYIERARVELARRQPGNAAPLLAAAARLAPARSDLAVLGGATAEALPELRDTGLPPVTGVYFLDGGDAIIATADDVRRWSPADHRERWRVPVARVSGLLPGDAGSVVGTTEHGAVILAIDDGRLLARLGAIPPPTESWVVSGLVSGGRWLALKGPEGHVEVWDLPRRRLAGRFTTPLPSGYALASPDGAKVFVSGSGDRPMPAYLYDVASGRRLATVCDVDRPCGRTEPIGGEDSFVVARDLTAAGGSVSVFDWSGNQRHRMELESPVLDVDIVEDLGAVVVLCHDGELLVRDLVSGDRRWSSRALTRGYGLELDRAGRRLWAFGRDGGVAVFDVDTGVQLGWWWVPDMPIGMFVAPAAAHVLMLDGALNARRWSPQAIATQVIAPTQERVWRLHWLDDERVLSGSADGAIALHDARSGEVVRWMRGHSDRVVELQPMPGGRVLSAGRDDDVIVWDLASGAAIERIEDAGPRAAPSPDGKRVAIGDTNGRVTVRAILAAGGAAGGATGDVRELGQLPRSIMAVRWSADGRWIAAIDDGGTVRVWRAHDGTQVRALDGLEAPRRGGIDVMFSPNSRYLAMGRLARTVLLDLETGGDVVLQGAPEDMSWALAFSADSERVATSEDDGDVTVWSTRTGEALLRVSTPGVTPAVSFAPDGRTLVTGTVDRTVRVWDLATGTELGAYQAPDEVYTLRWSPDGTRLGVTTLAAAVLWRPPHALGDSRELETLARCRTGVALGASGAVIPSDQTPLPRSLPCR